MQKSRLHIKKSFSIFAIFLFLFSNVAFIQPVQAADTITVEEAIENNEGNATVQGYIVGFATGKNTVLKDEEKFEDTNVAIATDPDEDNVENMLFVQVTSPHRDKIGLKSNPDNLGKEIIVTGSLETYHQRAGLKEPETIQFADEAEKELETITIKEAHEQGDGEVQVKGTVTAKLKNTIQIQDDTGGIALRPTSLDVSIGDEVTVAGSLQDYNKLLQLNVSDLVEKHGSASVDSNEINGNDLNIDVQSQLVTVKGVTLTNDQVGDGWINFSAEDENGNFVVRDEAESLDLEVGKTYDSITGIVIPFNDELQIIPRDKNDIVENEGQTRPVYATPGEGTLPSGTEVTLQSSTDDADIYYTIDGSEPSESNGTLYDEPIVLEEDTTIKAIAYKDELEKSTITTFNYTVYDQEKGMQIHDIQGDGHESPYVGHVVKDVEGIVTYKYEIRGANYFHLQAEEENYDGNKDTSEAIIVYTGREENIDIGDKVRVAGSVDEYYIDGYDDRAETDLSVTQINARNDRGGSIETVEEDVELPDPITIRSSDIPGRVIGEEGFDVFDRENNAIDFWESIEGMLVEVPPAKAVAPQEHGDLTVVTEEFETDTIHGGVLIGQDEPNSQFIQYKLYPNSEARDLKVKTGDLFTDDITGVVNYGFQNYKVYADLDDIEAAFEEGPTEPKETTLDLDDDKLSIAAYNVENFSANTKETSEDKAANIARAIVQDMHAPDVVALIEMQDNNGQEEGPEDADASETFERLIRVVEEAGGPTYNYVNIDPNYNEDGGAPHGNIRVGYIYNEDRVSLVDGDIGTPDDAVAYEDGALTYNPGRIGTDEAAFEGTRKPLAAQFEFNGETFVTVANHLSSKLGDEAIFGQNQPPELKSEPQRIEQANILNEFFKDIKADNEEENIIVLGDMNDFEFSPSVQALQEDVLTNLIDTVPDEDRYTYVYQGNSQVLDHILVSNNLVDQSEIDILHVNADFTPMHGRASDHEPILAQIDLLAEEDDEKGSGNKEDDEEEKGSGNKEEDDEEEKGSGNKEEDEEEKGSGNENEDPKQETETDDSEGNGNATNDDALGESTTNDTDGTGKEDTLPKTATTMYTILVIGLLVTASGITIYVVRRIRYNA